MYLVRTETFAKAFFLITCAGLVLYAMLAFYTFHQAFSNLTHMINQDNLVQKFTYNKPVDYVRSDMQYILIWTVLNSTIVDFDEGQSVFTDQKCSHTNCFITSNKSYLNDDYKQFDAVVFNVSTITQWNMDIPKIRAQNQKFIFHCLESSYLYPVCPVFVDDFFNLTWTYKLDSDIPHPLFEVIDLAGNLVAPKETVKWDDSMTNLTEYDLIPLRRKRKAVITVMVNCDDGRFEYAQKLRKLFSKNFLDFDIFGCGMMECPENICYRIIKQNYYFYFVFEGGLATDYVSKEILKAYNNYAVPVVMGTADYKRFLPEGSYINANSISMDGIVALIEYTINNPAVYQSFHRWRKIYSINERQPYKGFCELCAKLNDWKGVKYKSDLRKWWFNGKLHDRCVPGGFINIEDVVTANQTR